MRTRGGVTLADLAPEIAAALGESPLATILARGERAIWANSAAERLFAVGRGGLAGRPLSTLLEPGGWQVADALAGGEAVPVVVDRREIGRGITALYLDDRRRTRDLQAELAQMRYHLDVLSRAHQAERLGPIEGMSLAVWIRPVELLGGDFVDLVPLDDERRALVLADASGSGAPAWVAASAARHYLRAGLWREASLAEALRRANGALREDLPNGAFVTALVAVIDPARRAVEIACAGHPAPLRVARGAARAVALPPNSPLGLAAGAGYETRSLVLDDDERLVLFTDGLVDHRDADGTPFGIEGITRSMAGAADASGALAAIRDAARRFGEFTDDAAAVVLRARPSPLPLLAVHVPPRLDRVPSVRRSVEAIGRRAGLDDEAIWSLATAVNEAVTNAITHGQVPGMDNTVEVVCWVDADAVVVQIASRRTGWIVPAGGPGSGASGGYGLTLMRALTDALTIVQGPSGTTVTLRRGRSSGA